MRPMAASMQHATKPLHPALGKPMVQSVCFSLWCKLADVSANKGNREKACFQPLGEVKGMLMEKKLGGEVA